MRPYHQLDLDERVEIQRRLEAGDSLREIGRSLLGLSPSAISRECRRAKDTGEVSARRLCKGARKLRRKPRVSRELTDPILFAAVEGHLRAGWSPQQVAGILADSGRTILARLTSRDRRLTCDANQEKC